MRFFPLPALRYPLPNYFVLTCVLAGCGGAEASNLAEAVVDTLPGGIERVTSSGPTAWSDSGGKRPERANKSERQHRAGNRARAQQRFVSRNGEGWSREYRQIRGD